VRADLLRRLEALEAATAGAGRTAEVARKPSHLMSDADAVQAVHALCHEHPPGSVNRPLSPSEEAEVSRLWAIIRAAEARP
jgi:hypothetical protein